MTNKSVRRRRESRKWSGSGKRMWCSLVYLIRAECSQPPDRLWSCCGLIITPHIAHLKRPEERETNTESRLLHSSSASACGCAVICNCRPDKSHRGLSAHVTGWNRFLIYCHICWAEWKHERQKAGQRASVIARSISSLSSWTATN